MTHMEKMDLKRVTTAHIMIFSPGLFHEFEEKTKEILDCMQQIG